MAIKIRTGYEISYECPQPTPMILTLSVHPSRRADLVTPDWMRVHPMVPVREYSDGFSNICHVVRAPAGLLTIASDFVIEDSGAPDRGRAACRRSISLDALPVETLVYLLGSRYCETDRLSEFAWRPSAACRRAGARCRRSATSCTTTSRSATSTPARPRPPTTPSRSGAACAATSPISPSRSAAA